MSKEYSKKRLELVFEKTQGRCAYCGKELSDDATIDHVIPRSKGGSNSLDNLLPSCRSCNTSKGVKSLEEFRFWRTFKVNNTPTFTTEQLLYLSTKVELSKLFPPLIKFYFETMQILPSAEGMVVREWR